MNLPQSKILLEKIIALYKSMSADEKNIAAIERDLMLNYIRQLYETFLDAPPSVSQPAKTIPTVAPPPPPKVEIPKPQSVPPPPPPAPKPVEEPPKPVIETPRRVEPVVPPSPPPPPKAPPSVVEVFNPDIEALFEASVGKELSDKLSNMPITDLTKAFALNDRILTINELFAGNKGVFDAAIADLNGMSSFEKAKLYLIDIATRNNWAGTEDRKKQAKGFIKLVRRRFN